MQDWIIKPGAVIQLTLAADARLVKTSYVDDQIWEFNTQRGEPPGLSLETTFGLRARSLRILPRFTLAGTCVNSLSEFASPVTVREYYPNYLMLSFSPFEDFEVSLAYWVPTSQAIASRIALTNLTKQNLSVQIEWVGLLIPNDPGERMSNIELSNVTALWGKSGGVEPVLILAGGANQSKGSFPGIFQDIELKPNRQACVISALASLSEGNASLELARTIVSKNWEAEVARIKMVNADRLQVITGDPDWNQILDISQTIGASLLMSPTESLPNTSFVMARQPDHGYSARGDGSDYNYLWNGQTALHALFLSEEVLPNLSRIGIGLLDNFLSVQTENGFTDWKPGLAKQRGKLNATPVLATLAWSLYSRTGNKDFITRIYPQLKLFVDYWFHPENDIDQDGIPEWSHIFQTGFDDNLLFNFWREDSQGVNISAVESPDLCSMLYMECRALQKLAEVIGVEPITGLVHKAERLREKVEQCWQDLTNSYQYCDRDSHLCMQPQTLATRPNAGDIFIRQSFDQPVRLQIRLYKPQDSTRRVTAFIHGMSPSGDHRIERITPEQFTWHMQGGFATSEKIFAQLDKIVIEGIQDEDLVVIQTVGHVWKDHTLLLPLWAGIPSESRTSRLLDNTVLEPNQFWLPGGIPNYPRTAEIDMQVHMPYNALILRGLLQYGYREQAVDLITRIMNTLVKQIHQEGVFRQTYQAENGLGRGEKNTLEGLAPLGVFLEILGVHILSPWKIKITRRNPFPWPVTVKYCGTTILRKSIETTIIFPDGQSVSVDEDAIHWVSLD